ncbi:substrate-binding domain-containing protein [Castellaniella sp.]|uniref:substrate-binding domain-containing protein n=1 Tax=Castellaniella sp. TaxID=1955812 RepID=UPI002AFFD86C|nr:substrate-binding domain-containing protein [Castellaniella sp.]
MAVYRFKPRLNSEWVLEKQSGEILPMGEVMRLLAAVDEHGHIAGACQARGLSYRHAWGILRKAEANFQVPLIETSRRRGSRLTSFAQHLLWANRRIDARLAPTFESIASELQEELQRLYSEELSVLRLHASHGFAVEGLMRLANGQDMLPLELRYRTGIEALSSLDRGECDLAGFQVPVDEYEKPILQRYGHWLNPDSMLLLHLAERNTGLFVPPGNPKNIRSVQDLVRPDVRFVNRQMGSSTRFLVHLMLERQGIDPSRVTGFDSGEFTHLAIAAHIASGMADVGIGVETAAWRCGLEFIPLAKERYFFGINKNLVGTQSLQRLLDLMNGADYQAYVRDLVGYDCSLMGQVQTLEQAFGAEYA